MSVVEGEVHAKATQLAGCRQAAAGTAVRLSLARLIQAAPGTGTEAAFTISAAVGDGRDRLPAQYVVGRGRRYEAILSGMASAVKRMSRICVRPARQVLANA